MKYVLLLRGINVGGKNLVAMNGLRVQLETVGFEEVSTYINSGNIFFESPDPYEKLVEKIKQLLQDNYEFPIPIALINQEEFNREFQQLPTWWTQETFARHDVLFYTDLISKSEVATFIEKFILTDEEVYIGNLGVFWGKYNEASYLKNAYHQHLVKSPIYRQITIRNGNTYEKIRLKLQ